MPTENLFTLTVISALKSVDSEHENSPKKRKIFAKILEDITTHQQGGDEKKNTGSFWAMSSEVWKWGELFSGEVFYF